MSTPRKRPKKLTEIQKFKKWVVDFSGAMWGIGYAHKKREERKAKSK